MRLRARMRADRIGALPASDEGFAPTMHGPVEHYRPCPSPFLKGAKAVVEGSGGGGFSTGST